MPCSWPMCILHLACPGPPSDLTSRDQPLAEEELCEWPSSGQCEPQWLPQETDVRGRMPGEFVHWVYYEILHSDPRFLWAYRCQLVLPLGSLTSWRQTLRCCESTT